MPRANRTTDGVAPVFVHPTSDYQEALNHSMRNVTSTYRFPMICSIWVLLACSNVAHGEYREQWLGAAEMRREADAHRRAAPKSAHAIGIPEQARKQLPHTSARHTLPATEDDPIASFAGTDVKPGAAKLRKPGTKHVAS